MTDRASVGGEAVTPRGNTRRAHAAVLGMVCALVIGVYGWCANRGNLEVWGTGPGDSYYNLQWEGFRAGQLHLKRTVPPGFAQLANPYDRAASEPFLWQPNLPLQDLSYYQGKFYLYFGVTPVLLLFGPYQLLTGHFLLHKDAVVIFLSISFLASVRLLWSVWRRYFAGVSFAIVVAGTLALGLANLSPVILQRADVYEVAIGCGQALTMLALLAIWRALHRPQRRGGWLAAASVLYGLALGARPSLLFGAIILLVPVLQAWRERQRIGPLLVAAMGPIVLIGIGLMVYNFVRFGDPREFGQRYQLPLPETAQQFSWRYLWFNFRVGFLEPARWGGGFPFVHDIAVSAWPKGAAFEHPFGVLTNVPFVWLALAAPLAWRNEAGAARSALRWFVMAMAVWFAAIALTIGLHNSMCLRYELEFTQPLVFLAIVGIFALERACGATTNGALSSRSARLGSRRAGALRSWGLAVRIGWGLLLAFSIAFNLLASVQLHSQARYYLATALLEKGSVDEAIPEFERALAIRPEYALAHDHLGIALSRKARLDEAIAHFQNAIRIQPDFGVAHNNLGNVYLQLGRLDEAMGEFQKALAINPHYAEAYYNVGEAKLQQGKLEEGRACYEKALALQPNFAPAHGSLGNILLSQGQVDEAIGHYRQALALRPDDAVGHNNLGSALQLKRQEREAIVEFEKALAIQPAYALSHNNLAWLFATSAEAAIRNGAKAIEHGQWADQYSGGNDPMNIATLAAAYAEAGRFAEAIATARRALALATAQHDGALTASLQRQIKLYEAGSPYRDAP